MNYIARRTRCKKLDMSNRLKKSWNKDQQKTGIMEWFVMLLHTCFEVKANICC